MVSFAPLEAGSGIPNIKAGIMAYTTSVHDGFRQSVQADADDHDRVCICGWRLHLQVPGCDLLEAEVA